MQTKIDSNEKINKEFSQIVTAEIKDEKNIICRCNRKLQIIAYVAVGLISLFVFFAFLNNLNFLKESEYDKVNLENIVVAEADHYDSLLLQQQKSSQENTVLSNYYNTLETSRVGTFDKDSFWFILDFDSYFWVMGGNPLLAKNFTNKYNVKRPGQYNAKDMDETVNDNPIADFIRVAKRGGGYVEFFWMYSKPMLAYVKNLKNSPFVIGAAIPLEQHI